MKIYLSGPIEDVSATDAKSWRDQATEILGQLGHETLDPLRHAYEGRKGEPGISAEIVAADILDIDICDVLMRFAPFPSEGSAQETFYAYRQGKPVVVIYPHPIKRPSPWLVEHSTVIVFDLLDACAAIERMHDDILHRKVLAV